MLTHWNAEERIEKVRVFLCGVTPEIATMDWPFPIKLTAMDQAPSMVERVWPGDVPGVRRARVGNWLNSGLPAQSQHVVIGDGGFGFFSFPDDQRKLLQAMHRLLGPGGLFLYRHYAQTESRERVERVFDDLRARKISNFHIFKWRLAMAMQADPTAGVKQDDIWQAWTNANIDITKLPQPGFSQRAVNTIHFYRGKPSRLYFPTLKQFQELLSEQFEKIQIEQPGYEIGERCPIMCARPKP